MYGGWDGEKEYGHVDKGVADYRDVCGCHIGELGHNCCRENEDEEQDPEISHYPARESWWSDGSFEIVHVAG